MSDTPRHPIVQEWLAGGSDAGGCVAALERELAEQAPLVEKAIRDLAAGVLEVRQARNEILRADTDARNAIAKCAEWERSSEIYAHQRDREHARFERVFAILMRIHHLLAPTPVESGGKTYVFDVNSPLWMDAYQQLCERIRAIPDELDKAKNEEPQ